MIKEDLDRLFDNHIWDYTRNNELIKKIIICNNDIENSNNNIENSINYIRNSNEYNSYPNGLIRNSMINDYDIQYNDNIEHLRLNILKIKIIKIQNSLIMLKLIINKYDQYTNNIYLPSEIWSNIADQIKQKMKQKFKNYKELEISMKFCKLEKFCKLRLRGYNTSKNYNLNSDYDEMVIEYKILMKNLNDFLHKNILDSYNKLITEEPDYIKDKLK